MILFSIQTQLKTFLEMSVQHGDERYLVRKQNKISFDKIKGAFSCGA